MEKSKNSAKSSKTEGNTKPRSYQENPKKSWCFTVFNYDKELITKMSAVSAKHRLKYCFGEEICPTTEKKHLQCFINSSKKIRWTAVFDGILPNNTHREACKGSFQSNMDYCMKDGLYYTNVKTMAVKEKDIIELRDWQNWAIERIKLRGSEDRKILWIYDYKGGIGKSVLVDYLVYEYNAIALNGAKRHCLSTAYKNPENKIWIFDIPRVNNGGVSYESIEALRNGLFYSGFGDSTGMRRLDFNPIVVVLCNEEPKWHKLSMDRWDVWEIVNQEPIQRFYPIESSDSSSED